MHKFTFLRLVWTAVALAIVPPILSACAAPSVSGRQKVESKILPGTHQRRVVRVPDSGISAGPENVVNPRKRQIQPVESAPKNQQ